MAATLALSTQEAGVRHWNTDAETTRVSAFLLANRKRHRKWPAPLHLRCIATSTSNWKSYWKCGF